MLSKSRFLKSTVIAALVGLAGVASVSPAGARDFDDHAGYHRDRDSGWGDRDRFDRHDRFDRADRFDRWYWRHHRHHFHGWY